MIHAFVGLLSLCNPSVVSSKVDEEQMQILRLTTPKLHPKEQKRTLGTPERRLGPRSLRMTAAFLGANF